jgi:hypothetical protein
MRNKSHFGKGVLIFSLIISLAALSCDKKPTGITTFTPSNFPTTPDNIRVVVGDKIVVFEWSFSDTSFSIQKFNIYRATSSPANFSLVNSSTTSSFEDRAVQNNVIYYYQVSAVDQEGFEGKRSEAIAAQPGQFSLVIDDGADFTNETSVNLSISASTGLKSMLLSNDSSFANASLKDFSKSTPWSLLFGDGVKTVYAKFQDESGKMTTLPVKDSIFLDTQAIISAVTENTGGAQKVAGDTIHITLISQEPFGQAQASVENGPENLLLFDNGTNGDVLANDGIYELDYIVPQNLDVFEARILGSFTDRVNNRAVDVFSSTRITIKHPPKPVTLFSPVLDFDSGGQIGLKLSWTESEDKGDFASYLIYRSLAPNVIPETATLLTSITSQKDVSFLDQTVVRNNDYYYRIFVSDLTGLSAGSNEVSGSTTGSTR